MSTYDEVLDRAGLVTAGMIPTKYVNGIIQETIKQSACMSLMRKLPNMSTKVESMPLMNLFPQAYWVNSEAGDGTNGGHPEADGLLETTEQGWTYATITAAKMGVIVPIPKDTIDDAVSNGYDLWGEIKPRLAESIARKFDQAIIHGTGSPTGFPTDIVTAAGTKSTTLAHNSSADLKDYYDEILGVGGIFSLVEGKRFRVSGVLADVSMMSGLRGLRASDGVPLWATGNGQAGYNYSLAGVPVNFPENDCIDPTAALMIAGDWSKAMYSWRQDISITMTDAGMITGATGTVLLNAFQQDVVLMKAVCRIGAVIPIAADIAGTSNRYPFAVLTPAA
jgi:HK97 family phage major capsid protein